MRAMPYSRIYPCTYRKFSEYKVKKSEYIYTLHAV